MVERSVKKKKLERIHEIVCGTEIDLLHLLLELGVYI